MMKTVFACALCLVGNLIAADEFALEGTWKAVTTMPDGDERPSTIVISKKDDKLEGVASTSSGERALKDVVVKEEEVTFAIDLEYEGTPFTFKVTAKPDGDTLKGGWDAVGESGDSLASGDWQAAREVVEPNPLVGDWKVTALDPESNELSFDMTLAEAEGKLSGSMKSDAGGMDFKSIKHEDDAVTMVVPFPYDGQEYPITINATLDGDHLKGKWTAHNADGNEEASGEWKAQREGAPTFEGVWETAATLPDETENKAVYHIGPGEKEGSWTGKVVSDTSEIAFDKVSVEDNGITIDMELPYNDAKIEVRVKGKMSKDGSGFEGEWIAFDESGQEAAKGAIKGARKTES